MPANNLPYWATDPDFPKRDHRLIIERVFPELDDSSGSCACGEFLGIGANYTILENFDSHAETVQRARYTQ